MQGQKNEDATFLCIDRHVVRHAVHIGFQSRVAKHHALRRTGGAGSVYDDCCIVVIWFGKCCPRKDGTCWFVLKRQAFVIVNNENLRLLFAIGGGEAILQHWLLLLRHPNSIGPAVVQDVGHVTCGARSIHRHRNAFVQPNREEGIRPALAVLAKDDSLGLLTFRCLSRKLRHALKQFAVSHIVFACDNGNFIQINHRTPYYINLLQRYENLSKC